MTTKPYWTRRVASKTTAPLEKTVTYFSAMRTKYPADPAIRQKLAISSELLSARRAGVK